MNQAAQLPPAARAWQLLRAAGAWLAGFWESLSIYLPLVLMAVLAVTTYWLVRNTPELPGATAARPAMHEVDYSMQRATIKTFDAAGRLQSELFGVELRHYADNATVEVDQARLRSISPEGRVTVATAKRALARDDGSEVQLIGEALVVREAVDRPKGQPLPRMEFRGEFLHIFARDERIQSHLPVTLLRGADEFSADKLNYSNLDRVLDLQGRVKGRLVPSGAPQRAQP